MCASGARTAHGRHDSDLAVVVSNDSDLCEPIRVVKDEFDVPGALLIPHNRTSQALSKLKPLFITADCIQPVTTKANRSDPSDRTTWPDPQLEATDGAARQPPIIHVASEWAALRNGKRRA